jgi:hypothetical protein
VAPSGALERAEDRRYPSDMDKSFVGKWRFVPEPILVRPAPPGVKSSRMEPRLRLSEASRAYHLRSWGLRTGRCLVIGPTEWLRVPSQNTGSSVLGGHFLHVVNDHYLNLPLVRFESQTQRTYC